MTTPTVAAPVQDTSAPSPGINGKGTPGLPDAPLRTREELRAQLDSAVKALGAVVPQADRLGEGAGKAAATKRLEGLEGAVAKSAAKKIVKQLADTSKSSRKQKQKLARQEAGLRALTVEQWTGLEDLRAAAAAAAPAPGQEPRTVAGPSRSSATATAKRATTGVQKKLDRLKGKKAGPAATEQAAPTAAPASPASGDKAQPQGDAGAKAKAKFDAIAYKGLFDGAERTSATQERAADLLHREVQEIAARRVARSRLKDYVPGVAEASKAAHADVLKKATTAGKAAAGSASVVAAVQEGHRMVDQARSWLDEPDLAGIGTANQTVQAVVLTLGETVSTQAGDAVKAADAAATRTADKHLPKMLLALRAGMGVQDFRTHLKDDTQQLTQEVLEAQDTDGEPQAETRAADLADAKRAAALKLTRGVMGSSAARFARLVDKQVPRSGDAASMTFAMEAEGNGWSVGIEVEGTVERDNDTDETVSSVGNKDSIRAALKVTVTGAGNAGGAKLGAKAGLFMDVTSKTGPGLADVWSYGLYRTFMENNMFPQEVIGKLWGAEGVTRVEGQVEVDATFVEAAAWAEMVEASMSKKDEYWSGLVLGGFAQIGRGPLEASAGATLMTGTSYDKEGIEAAKQGGKVQADRRRLDEAAEDGRGVQRGKAASVGYGKTKFSTSVEASDGALSGEAGAEFSWTGDAFSGWGVSGSYGFTLPVSFGLEDSMTDRVVSGVTNLAPLVRRALTEGSLKAEADGGVGQARADAAKSDIAATAQAVETLADGGAMRQHLGAAIAERAKELGAPDVGGMLDAVGTVSLTVGANVSRSRSVEKLPDGKVKAGDWDKPRVVVELRHERGLGIAVDGAVEISFKKSQRLARLQLLPDVKVD